MPPTGLPVIVHVTVQHENMHVPCIRTSSQNDHASGDQSLTSHWHINNVIMMLRPVFFGYTCRSLPLLCNMLPHVLWLDTLENQFPGALH
jgi:hypothetical protein